MARDVFLTVIRTMVPMKELPCPMLVIFILQCSRCLGKGAYGMINPNITNKFCPVFLTNHADPNSTIMI